MRLLLIASLFMALVLPAAASEMTPRQAHDALGRGEIVLVDIRTPPEWKETGIAEKAVPLDMTSASFIPGLQKLLAENPGKPIALICRTGNRSSYLSGELRRAGLSGVIDVVGGMAGSRTVKGWIAEGLPVSQP